MDSIGYISALSGLEIKKIEYGNDLGLIIDIVKAIKESIND